MATQITTEEQCPVPTVTEEMVRQMLAAGWQKWVLHQSLAYEWAIFYRPCGLAGIRLEVARRKSDGHRSLEATYQDPAIQWMIPVEYLVEAAAILQIPIPGYKIIREEGAEG